MLIERVHRDSPLPLHVQVAASLRRAVRQGECAAGERLPSARDLAFAFGVNTNTMLRALRTLRDEGLLEFRRGRGVCVAVNIVDQRGAFIDSLRTLMDAALNYGYRREEVIAMIRDLP